MSNDTKSKPRTNQQIAGEARRRKGRHFEATRAVAVRKDLGLICETPASMRWRPTQR